MRNSIILYINGVRHELTGAEAFMSVANYLRYKKSLTGTKVVCSEGDCGACTVLLSRYQNGKMQRYRSINSCISFMYLLDKCHLITVEGLGDFSHLHEVQEKMVEHHGAQCGYCTPGIVCSLASLSEDAKNKDVELDEKKVKNYLTGNLCRCTGYEPIIEAGKNIDLTKVKTFKDSFGHDQLEDEYKSLDNQSIYLKHDEKSVFLPKDLNSYFAHDEITDMNITSGATDLGVVHNKGKINLEQIVSLNAIDDLYNVVEDDNFLIVGAKASLTDVEQACLKSHTEFSKLIHVFASPQIKNKGTLIGNVMNASPIGDTIPFLRVADAILCLTNGKEAREININDFILPGYKQLDIKENEIVTHIKIPKSDLEYKIYKVAVRKDLDISSVSLAVSYKLNGDIIENIKIAYGGVGPSVLRLEKLESKTQGKKIEKTLVKELASLVDNEITPLSDLRGSESYRRKLAHNLLLKFFDEVTKENALGFKEASL